MSYKIKKASELREMSSEQLKKRILEINATQMQMKAHQITKHAMNPGQWKSIKKEKARILTILGERKNPGKGGFRRH